jgi:hypothetical protein
MRATVAGVAVVGADTTSAGGCELTTAGGPRVAPSTAPIAVTTGYGPRSRRYYYHHHRRCGGVARCRVVPPPIGHRAG